MDNRAEVRELLTSRRAKVTAQQAAMHDVGRRRVPGLRRSEVAALSGVSVEYYANFARFTSCTTPTETSYPNWDEAADTGVAILRTEAGRDPHEKDSQDLVGELSSCSDEFRRRWATHNVRYVGAGVKLFNHDLVGDLELGYESVDMLSDAGLTLTLYAAEPGSATEHALDLLVSWTSTEHPAALDRADH